MIITNFDKMGKLGIKILIIMLFLCCNLTFAANKNHINSNGKGAGTAKQVEDYKLYQNFPNPFNPNTIIGFKINTPGIVSVKVHNLVGQVIATLVDEYKNPGSYEVNFDASNLSAGVYLYKLQINDFVSVKRMTLIK
ncbi:hypothetical protein BH10BAC5_BH10BAC5_00720 [soil metagenome]